VAEPVVETPDSVRDALGRMRAELTGLCVEGSQNRHNHSLPTDAYKRVLENCRSPSPSLPPSTYVEKDDFLLQFLRAERFDARRAAERVLKYCDLKERTFGSKILYKEHVLLSDLDDDATACLESGGMQVLPGRDLGGRPIFMGLGKLRSVRSEQSLVRVPQQYGLGRTEASMQNKGQEQRVNVGATLPHA
jgi:hypothetical protein